MTTEAPAPATNPIGELRAKLEASTAQLADLREQIAKHEGELARLDQALAGVTLASKPLEVLAARERRTQLQAEIRRLRVQIPPLEQEYDSLDLQYSGWASKLEQARRLRAGVSGGTLDRRAGRMDFGELKTALDRAAQLLAWAGEPCEPVVIRL